MKGWLQRLSGSWAGRSHRPFNEADLKLLRRVPKNPTSPTSLAVEVPANENPGVRCAASFLSEAEAAECLAAARDALDEFGISHVTAETRAWHAQQMEHLELADPAALVNMRRLTGRDEEAAWIEERQRRAPWGYGEGFEAGALPEPLRARAV